MKKQKQSDEVCELVKDACIFMLTIKLHMSRHTMLKIPFSQGKREQVYKEFAEMQKRLDGVDTSTMKSSLSPESFVVFKAKFLIFEHEVIDFINLFHVRVFGKVTMFERDVVATKIYRPTYLST